MLAKIEDLKLVDAAGNPLGWAETLIVDTDEPLKVPDVDDDLARETLMYVLQFHPSFLSSTMLLPSICPLNLTNPICSSVIIRR